jgi:DMSO/TMAO reductase YedYZ molybdopterin-dependent catalytic subunit
MAVSLLDHERGRQDGVDAGLIVHRTDPLNCETDLRALIGGVVSELLARCRPRASARHVVFRGADRGCEPGSAGPIRYERSLNLEEAMASEALLAYAMNGEPLPAAHGYPPRLVVPSWFAMASVKWLSQIELIDHEFAGYFHTEAYVYEDRRGARKRVERQNVRSVIIEPVARQRRPRGPLMIRGAAWSGEASIRRVEVSVDGGLWPPASLVGERTRYGWRWWELLTRVERPGAVTIRARATEEAGRTQPDQAPWNRMGYGNNGVHAVEVQVR